MPRTEQGVVEKCVQCAGCQLLDTTFLGSVVRQLRNTASFETCQQNCQNEANCAFWTWNLRTKLCQLRNKAPYGYVSDSSTNGIIAGPKYCPNDGRCSVNRVSQGIRWHQLRMTVDGVAAWCCPQTCAWNKRTTWGTTWRQSKTEVSPVPLSAGPSAVTQRGASSGRGCRKLGTATSRPQTRCWARPTAWPALEGFQDRGSASCTMVRACNIPWTSYTLAGHPHWHRCCCRCQPCRLHRTKHRLPEPVGHIYQEH